MEYQLVTVKKDSGKYFYIQRHYSSDVSKQKKEALKVIVLNNTRVRLKVDTGAEVNVMPKRVFDCLEEKTVIQVTSVKLKGYRAPEVTNYLFSERAL